MDRHPTPSAQADALRDAVENTLAALGYEEHSPSDFRAELTLRGNRFRLRFWSMHIASAFAQPSAGDLQWSDEIQASADDAVSALHAHLGGTAGITMDHDTRSEQYSGKTEALIHALNGLRARSGQPPLTAPQAVRGR